eukprot:Hpha_TRINITY_DN16629_c3_g12::TRINITY_DN16629_c3_g12_i1::g.183023::m.183023
MDSLTMAYPITIIGEMAESPRTRGSRRPLPVDSPRQEAPPTAASPAPRSCPRLRKTQKLPPSEVELRRQLEAASKELDEVEMSGLPLIGQAKGRFTVRGLIVKMRRVREAAREEEDDTPSPSRNQKVRGCSPHLLVRRSPIPRTDLPVPAPDRSQSASASYSASASPSPSSPKRRVTSVSRRLYPSDLSALRPRKQPAKKPPTPEKVRMRMVERMYHDPLKKRQEAQQKWRVQMDMPVRIALNGRKDKRLTDAEIRESGERLCKAEQEKRAAGMKTLCDKLLADPPRGSGRLAAAVQKEAAQRLCNGALDHSKKVTQMLKEKYMRK